jgi:hypothetical protein
MISIEPWMLSSFKTKETETNWENKSLVKILEVYHSLVSVRVCWCEEWKMKREIVGVFSMFSVCLVCVCV